MLDFAAKVFEVDNGAVAKNVYNAASKNARRYEVKGEFPHFVYNCMAGVVAALITHNNIIIACDKVDHAALSFISPVNSDNSAGRHNFPSRIIINNNVFYRNKGAKTSSKTKYVK